MGRRRGDGLAWSAGRLGDCAGSRVLTDAVYEDKDGNPRALLICAHRKVADLFQPDGWEGGYPGDVWQLRRLGYHGRRTVRFEGIPQP